VLDKAVREVNGKKVPVLDVTYKVALWNPEVVAKRVMKTGLATGIDEALEIIRIRIKKKHPFLFDGGGKLLTTEELYTTVKENFKTQVRIKQLISDLSLVK
jgi:hypothetical protein